MKTLSYQTHGLFEKTEQNRVIASGPLRLGAAALACALAITAAPQAGAQSMLVDFGPSTVTVNGTAGVNSLTVNATSNGPDVNGNYWNNWTSTTLNTSANITSTINAATGVAIKLTATASLAANGGEGVSSGGIGLNNFPLTQIDNPNFRVLTAVQDFLYMNTGTAGPTQNSTFTFSGLNQWETYDFSILATRPVTTSTDTRTTTFTVSGNNTGSQVVSTSANSTTPWTVGNTTFYGNANSANITAIAPNSGNITLTMNWTSGGSAVINALQLTGYVAYNTGNTTTVSVVKDYTGNTILSNETTVNATVAGALGNGTSSLVINGTGGTLNLSAGQSVASLGGAGNLTLTGGNSLTINGSVSSTYSGVLSGSGSPLVKQGSGTLILSGVNTFTGGVMLNGGTLGIYEGTSLGPIPGSPTTQLTFGGNSTLQFEKTPANLPINANRLIAINPGVTATIDTQGYSPSIAGVISGATGALAKIGNGTLTLNGNNTYGGGTTVTAGTLTLGSAHALGSTTGALSVNGATLNVGTYSATVGALTSTNGTFSGFNLGGSANTLAASSATLSGTTYIGINGTSITGTGTSNLITSLGGGLTGTVQFAGAQTLSVPVGSLVVKSGNGTFYLASLSNTGSAEQITISSAPDKVLSIMPLGASIMAGVTAQSPYNGGGFHTEMYQNLVNDGRFTPNFVGSSTALQTNNPTGPNILTSAGETNHEGHPGYTTGQILNNLNGNDNTAGNNGGYWLSVNNTATSGANSPNDIPLNVGGNDFSANHTDTQAIHRYDAIISKVSELRSGTTTLATSLMYRGDVGTYENTYFNPYIQGVVYNHVLAGQNVQFVDLYGLMTPGNSTAYISADGIHPTQVGYNRMGDIFYGSTVYGAAYWTGSQGGNWSTLNGTSTNWAMDAARTTDRQALLTDATANTYSYADVYFNGNASPLATTLGGNTTVRSLNFAAGATDSVTVGGNNTLTIGSGGITVQQGTGAHTVSSNVALASDQTWGNVSSNNLTVSGAMSGSGNLTIVGSSTVYTGANSTSITPTTVTGTGAIILAGNNTYTGTTTVTSGTLLINGSTSASSAVTVSVGATLGGNGTVGGFTTVNGDLKPGNSPGVLTFSGGLTLNGTTTMEINGTTTPGTDFDKVVVSGGTTTFGGALSLSFGSLLGNTINLFSFSGASLGNFSGVTSTGSYNGAWSVGVPNDTWTLSSGGQVLTFSEVTGNLNVVPEPSTWALLAFSLTTVMVRRRRRE